MLCLNIYFKKYYKHGAAGNIKSEAWNHCRRTAW